MFCFRFVFVLFCLVLFFFGAPNPEQHLGGVFDSRSKQKMSGTWNRWGTCLMSLFLGIVRTKRLLFLAVGSSHFCYFAQQLYVTCVFYLLVFVLVCSGSVNPRVCFVSKFILSVGFACLSVVCRSIG